MCSTTHEICSLDKYQLRKSQADVLPVSSLSVWISHYQQREDERATTLYKMNRSPAERSSFYCGLINLIDQSLAKPIAVQSLLHAGTVC